MNQALEIFLKEELNGINLRRQGIVQQIAQLEKQELVLSGAAQACEKMLGALSSPELLINQGTANVVTITAGQSGQIESDQLEAAE